MESIWNAAIAKPMQFRKLKAMRELREELIHLGADEGVLKIPAWLASSIH
jgi:hypothetical protein